MNRIMKVVFFILVIVFTVHIAHAAMPQLILFQGKLTNFSTGAPLNGSYQMNFSIYNAATYGVALWYENYTSQTVYATNGVIGVYLGSQKTLNLSFDTSYWLEIQVYNGTSWETLTPRQQLAAAPYAYAGGGWYVDGTTIRLLSSTNNVSAGALNVDNTNNKVSIGTATPYADTKLYVYDTGSTVSVIANNTDPASTGMTIISNKDGLYSQVPDAMGAAIIGSGSGYAVGCANFQNNYATGVGAYGKAPLIGADGRATYARDTSAGAIGSAWSSSGTNYGIYGQASSNSGTGVYGEAINTTGTNYGVVGNVSSASGYSGYFEGGKGVYVKSGNINTTGALNLKNGSTGQAIFVNNKEALWSDDTYFSWGYGNSYNYFSDAVTIGISTPAPPDYGLRIKGEAIMLEKGKNLIPDPDFSNTTGLWIAGAGEGGTTISSIAQEVVTLPNGQIVNSLKVTNNASIWLYPATIPADSTKTYRFSVWMKANSTTVGARYLGMNAYDSAGNNLGVYGNGNTTPDGNPYFWSATSLNDATNWHLIVGYLLPSNTATSWTFPPDTTRIASCVAAVCGNWKNNGSTVNIRMRLLNYYNGGTIVSAWFALPKIEEVDSDTASLVFNDTDMLLQPNVSSGTVGIGTVSPDSNYKLHVNTTGFSSMIIYSYGNNIALNASTSGTGNVAFFMAGSTAIWMNNSGMYCNNTCVKNATITTLRGESVGYTATESEKVELTKSGEGQLINGIAKVDFGYPFNESISDKVPVRVIITKNSDCSGLYVAEKSINGFTVKRTGNCPEDTKFDWYAIARRINY